MSWTLIFVLAMHAGPPAVIRLSDMPSKAACQARGHALERDKRYTGATYGAWACVAQETQFQVAPAVHGG